MGNIADSGKLDDMGIALGNCHPPRPTFIKVTMPYYALSHSTRMMILIDFSQFFKAEKNG